VLGRARWIAVVATAVALVLLPGGNGAVATAPTRVRPAATLTPGGADPAVTQDNRRCHACRGAPERAICARVTETGDRYRRRADAFETLITHTAPERWTSPSPCEGWLARDVVAHVVDYSGQVLRERAGMSEVSVFAEFDDPAAAFAAIREVVEQVLDDPETPPDMANYLDLAVSFDLPQRVGSRQGDWTRSSDGPRGGRTPVEQPLACSAGVGLAARERLVRRPGFRSQ